MPLMARVPSLVFDKETWGACCTSQFYKGFARSDISFYTGVVRDLGHLGSFIGAIMLYVCILLGLYKGL